MTAKKNNIKDIDYMIDITTKLLAIDSPTGYTDKAVEFLMKEYRALGYAPVKTAKGGILVELGGKAADQKEEHEPLLLEAHTDTLGAMVCEILSSGRLKCTPLGGMEPNNGEAENVRIYTRFGKVYEGTFQLQNASVHVNKEYHEAKREYKSMEVVIDEPVTKKEETEALDISVGDIVAFEPRTRVTESGYIKSRFLDDKLSVGILLGYARYLKENNITPTRKVYEYITVYEEVGHGGSGSIPEEVREVLSVDMGCVGDGLTCDERKVSICAKDSRGPYNYNVVTGLVQTAVDEKLSYAVDVYPYYGSDADAALTAGYDVRHGLIGSGVYASHGYERSHKDGVENTFRLLCAYTTR